MKVDYWNLNKVILIHAAVPSVLAFMDWLTNELGTYRFVADLENAFFSINIAPECQDLFAFTWEAWQCTFIVLPQGYFHSLTICHGLVAENLAKWPWPAAVHLFHYIDYILLTCDSLCRIRKGNTISNDKCCHN